ncbi:hypothetical protein [Streptomyces sp. NPDC020917]|uniref:hypothetical protein n=1 Tax=Streptomyces sp. NPDC020917 TaxID=3365102 RepID=UPI0037B24F5F
MAGETGEAVGGGAALGTRCQIDIGESGRFSWRLTASNGRVIALGAIAYPDEAACREAFEGLCRQPELLTGGVQHAAETSGWVWRLRDGEGRVRAVSARAYERHSTCQAAYERFRVLLLALRETPASLWGDAG